MLHIKLKYLDPYFEPSILPDKESLRKFLFEPTPRLFFAIPLPIFLSSLLVSQILPDIQSHAISFQFEYPDWLYRFYVLLTIVHRNLKSKYEKKWRRIPLRAKASVSGTVKSI